MRPNACQKPLIAVADSIATAIAGLAPFGRGFSRSRARVLALALAAVLAVAGLCSRKDPAGYGPPCAAGPLLRSARLRSTATR